MRVRLPRAAPAVRALWEKWALTETTLNVLAVERLCLLPLRPMIARRYATIRAEVERQGRSKSDGRSPAWVQRGDAIYTSDFDDMTRLATRFPGVRVMSV
jgi:hypothetical protein